MKLNYLFFTSILFLALTACSEEEDTPTTPEQVGQQNTGGNQQGSDPTVAGGEFDNTMDKVSYAWGMNAGLNMLQNFASMKLQQVVALKEVAKAFEDGVVKKNYTMSLEDIELAMKNFFTSMKSGQNPSQSVTIQASYGMGYDYAKNINQQIDYLEVDDEVNRELMMKGFTDVIQGKPRMISEEEQNNVLQSFFPQQTQRVYQKYKAKDDSTLSEIAKEEGIKKLGDTGILYKVLNEGSGAQPTAADSVVVHYHGTLLDGKVFDSSVLRKKPITVFTGGGVIQGWLDVLPKMQEGDKWKVYIPTDLAYGEGPRPGGAIKPGMSLIFEIELLEVKK